MEMEISGQGILPENLTGDELFNVRLSNEDCLQEDKRTAKDGGKFKQYTLFLEDVTTHEEKELRYLFSKHFNPLIKQWGKNSVSWEGNTLQIKPKKQGKFWDVELFPVATALNEEGVKIGYPL